VEAMTIEKEKPPRYVPIVTGLFWVAIAVALLFWNPESVLWYWVRNIIGGAACVFGLRSLWIGFFSPDEKLRNLMG
jgi:hypothetical protein